MTRLREPAAGDLIELVWADIVEDPVGDPTTAVAMRRVSYGLFVERRKAEIKGIDGDVYEIPVIVTTTTIDPDSTRSSGYCCYPADCVVEMRVVRRSKRSPA